MAQPQVFTSRIGTLDLYYLTLWGIAQLTLSCPTLGSRGCDCRNHPSFLIQSTEAPNGKWLSLIRPLLNSHLSTEFSPLNPVGITQYDTIDTEAVLNNGSITNSISGSRCNLGRSSEMIWTKFLTIEISRAWCVSSKGRRTTSENALTVFITLCTFYEQR